MRRSRFVLSLVLTASTLSLSGCPEDEPVPEVTYHQHIAPILAANCGSCHAPDGMQPDVLFDDAEEAQALAPLIAGMVATGAMPPFYAEETEDCPNPWGFTRDPRLSDEDKQLISAWASDGGPIGDPDNPAPIPEPPSLGLDDADLTAFPAGKYTTPPAGDVEDEFICLSIDPQLTEQKWLEALQVIPDDLEVVHHVLVGIDTLGASAALADENGVYPCFGAFGVEAQFIGGWIPSASPIEFPRESAIRVPETARIVLQMHYHLAAEEHEDGSGIALRWAEGTPVREATVTLIGNANEQNPDGTGLQPGPNDGATPAFFIPADESGHTETMVFDNYGWLPRELQVFFVANHMHYIGTDMRMWLERGEESPPSEDTNACLLHTPQWDFDWQQFYHYDASTSAESAPLLYPGDHLWLSCEYDNTLDNPGVVRALLEAGLTAPIDVVLGEGSLDEMCIGILGTTPNVPMTIDGETHAGDVVVQSTSEGFGFDAICDGPGSARIGPDNSIVGLAACGLDVGGLLASIEYNFDGSIAEGGSASGDITVTAVGVEGGGTVPWTGSYSGATLTVDVDATLPFNEIDVSFVGPLTTTLLE